MTATIAGIVLIGMSVLLFWLTYKNERRGSTDPASTAFKLLLVPVKYIWNSPRRWIWIIVIAVLGIAYGRAMLIWLVGDKPTSKIYATQVEYVFNPPADAKPPFRAEITESFVVKTTRGDKVIFEFEDGVLKEYTLGGQKQLFRSLNKASKSTMDMPFHKEKSLEGKSHRGRMIDFRRSGKVTGGMILKGSEIEWPRKPCVLKIRSSGGNPMELISKQVKFRHVPNKQLGTN